MATPQDPSVHRSKTIGSLAPDSIEGELEAYDRPGMKGNTGPIPPANRSPYDPEHPANDGDDEPANDEQTDHEGTETDG